MLEDIENHARSSDECRRTIDCVESSVGGSAPEFVKDGIRWDSYFTSKFDHEYVVFKFFRDTFNGIERQIREVLFHSADHDEALDFQQQSVAVEDRPFVRTVYYPKDAA